MKINTHFYHISLRSS